jgi:hypothetical protein
LESLKNKGFDWMWIQVLILVPFHELVWLEEDWGWILLKLFWFWLCYAGNGSTFAGTDISRASEVLEQKSRASESSYEILEISRLQLA